jgi:hypothetical protein
VPLKAKLAELELLGFDGLVVIPVSGGVVSLLPLSVMLELTGGFLLIAVSVAVSLAPVPLYWTVTLHDFPGARTFAVQLSAVFVNAAVPESVTISAPVAMPPVLLSVNFCAAVWPTATVP